MNQQSISELAAGLRAGHFTSVELTQHYLDRIQQLDQHYNCYITVTPELALQQAAAADRRLADGDAPLLCGIPIAHKDLFCTEGVKTSCGSKMLDNFVPPYSATIVENYQRDGAVMLGKLNMDEFAMGS
ncbi:MAG: amidase family protein, partial [Porticoccaceae bacterium]|nr:amidase family protein [Porticoccaceae bacterium]